MEEKRINERESLELITRMIADTRRKVETEDGNILLNWGILSVAVATITWIALLITGDPAFNGLWGLMALGIFLNRKQKRINLEKGYVSFTDRMSKKLWIPVTVMAFSSLAVCAVFDFALGKNIWQMMFTFPFLFVGFGSAVQGYIIEVKSLAYGGLFNMVVGTVLLAMVITGSKLTESWAMPLFIVCMTTLLIIPGLEIKRLARNDHERA